MSTFQNKFTINPWVCWRRRDGIAQVEGRGRELWEHQHSGDEGTVLN